MDKVLCSIATRGRYFTSLPLVLFAVLNQTRLPDKLIIFDDNDEPQDMRKEPLYQHIFSILDHKKIDWEWAFAEKKGQHYIHQRANSLGYKWVWRVDDDAIPEPNVLDRLFDTAVSRDNVGAVGGSIITMGMISTIDKCTGKIEDIDNEPNIQWGFPKTARKVEHLHCSFLYRAGIHDYHLGLSRVAHREETLFSYGLFKKGYDLFVIPNCITWHLKSPSGGIRSETKEEMYQHDEQIYKNLLELGDRPPIVLNCGLGDHIVFSNVLPDIPNPVIYGCYPEVFPCKSIAEAQATFGNLDQWNIYKKMDEWKWTGTLESAFRKLYQC